MKSHHIPIAFLLLILVPVWTLDAQTERTTRSWRMLDGAEVKGSFVKIFGNNVILKQNDKELSIALEWLSPDSLELARALNGGVNEKQIDTILQMKFVEVSPEIFTSNTFDMGAPKKDEILQEYEPSHRVKISKPFFLKETEVTWAEWNMVRDLAINYEYTDLSPGRNGYQGDETGNHPVTEVSWWDAVKWCNLKSQIEGKRPVYYTSSGLKPETLLRTGKGAKIIGSAKPEPELFMDPAADGYRLPTEAEWELAWHYGGKASGFPEPDGWHNELSGGNTHPVRTMKSVTSKKLHDMLGNVAEWCWDWKAPITRRDFELDPRGPDTGMSRIFRGGSWADNSYCCRPTYRGDYSPITPRSFFIGFRPARNAPAEARKTK